MLKFMRVRKDWTAIVCLKGSPGESFFCLKGTWQQSSGLTNNNTTSMDRQNQKGDFGHNTHPHVWWQLITSYQCGVLIIWACSAATGMGHHAVTESTSVESNMRSSVRLLKLVWNWDMQQDNDPRHCRKKWRRCSDLKSGRQLDWNAVVTP